MTDLKEIFKLLATHSPADVQLWEDQALVRDAQSVHQFAYSGEELGDHDQDLLQGATQRAVTRGGWIFSVMSATAGEHFAIIERALHEQEPVTTRHKSAAIALLTAYVDALDKWGKDGQRDAAESKA